MARTNYYRPSKRIEKLSRDEILNLSFDLINAFRLVKTPLESALLIQDLLTASEIRQLAVRLRIAKLLLAGNSQREISRTLHCSLATVTKVSAWVAQGGKGLKSVISKLPDKYEFPKNLPKIPIEFQLPQVVLAIAQYTIASRQGKLVKKFSEGVEDKRLLDKQLKELSDEHYKHSKK